MFPLLSPAIDNADNIANAVETALAAIMGDPDIASALIDAVGWVAIAAVVAIGLVIYVFGIFIHWRICSKAGYRGALSLLMLLPIVGYVLLMLFLALRRWPTGK